MWWFFLGVMVGFLTACTAMVSKIIGQLKYVAGDGEIHFFMELADPDVGNILRQKYVILEVDSNPSQK